MQQMEPVQFTINGRPVQGAPEETVLSAARRLNIQIPTLCHHEAIKPHGSCRLCVVEVFWGSRSKLVTSCIYTPYENDRIETDNERVHKIRRLVLELLLARCPEAEAIGRLAREYGVEAVRYGEESNREARCILCGLCVRVCDEVIGQQAIGYEDRGMARSIAAPFREPAKACIGCGACVRICPTGALHYEDAQDARLMKEFNTSVPMAECSACGVRYAPVALIEKVNRRVKREDNEIPLCPPCRRRISSERLSTWRSKFSSDNGDRGRRLMARVAVVPPGIRALEKDDNA